MNPSQWLILGLLSLANVWFAWWVSLRQRRYHGISRFLAFECIILLVLLQVSVWFRDPFRWYQVISWILLCGSLLLALFGFHQFYHKGKPSDRKEETTRLIRTGLYRYIRHPLYLSLILGGFGVMMKDPGWLQFALAGINFLFLFMTARIEEGEMIRKFGKDYARYMSESKMFIPFLF